MTTDQTPNPLAEIRREAELVALNATAEVAKERFAELDSTLTKLGVSVSLAGWTPPDDVPEVGDPELDAAAYRAAYYSSRTDYAREHATYHVAQRQREHAARMRQAKGLDRFVSAEGDRYNLDALTHANRRAAAQPQTLAAMREEGTR